MKTILCLIGCWLFVLIGFTQSLAQSTKGIKGNRQIESQERKVATFTKLHVSMGITAEIMDNVAGTIEVEAENNVLPYVLTEVKGDTLLITTVKGQQLQDITPIVVRLGVDRLTGFLIDIGASVIVRKSIHESDLAGTLASGGQIRADITASKLNLTLSGGAKASLTGHTDRAMVSLSGGSRLAGEKLTASQCEISLAGGCEASVHVDKTLSAKATGESQFFYTGDPVVKSVQTSGASTIEHSKR